MPRINNSTRRGYDHQYEKARKRILGPKGGGNLPHDPPCVWCGDPADTADHEPPISIAGPHLHLVPACKPCNSRRGQRSKRRQSRPW